MAARFFQRAYPSANTILLEGPRPILVDTGAGSDVGGLLDWLESLGQWPALVVNTHWHSDHAGGNHVLQGRGLAIAAPATEALAVNARAPDACRALFLNQQIESYRIDRCLEPGAVLETGIATWHVIGLPGHTAAQIGLFNEAAGLLISSDALHATDIGWLDLDAEPAALEQAESTIERIAALSLRVVLPGHGPAVTEPNSAVHHARRRLASWRTKPDRIAWHACKRILAHMLMLEDGLRLDQARDRLSRLPWLQAHARRAFRLEPEAFVPLLLEEMQRSGAAAVSAGRLVPCGAYRRVDRAWPPGPGTPRRMGLAFLGLRQARHLPPPGKTCEIVRINWEGPGCPGGPMPHLWKTASVVLSGLLGSALGRLTISEIEMVGKHVFTRAMGQRGTALGVFSSTIQGLENAAPNNVVDAGEAALLDRMKHLGFEVLFDVGANTGEWVNAAAISFPKARIDCFEIVPETFAKLTTSVQPGTAAVKLNDFGLSDTEGEVDVFLGDTDYISSVYTFDWDPKTEPVKCRVRRGVAYATEQGIERVDVLKIDVEGAESSVLRGMTGLLDRRGVRVVQSEYNRGAIESKFLLQDFYRFFVPRGYVLGKLTPKGVAFRDYAYVYEDFNGPNYVACLATDTAVIEAIRVPA